MKNLHQFVFVLTATLMAGAALAQGNERQISGIDISGSWYNAGGNGGDGMPILAEYGGMPLNESARLYALAWSPARMTVRQQQCAAYDPSRQLHGGGNYPFWEERDPVNLTEPYVRSTNQLRSERQPEAWLYACDDGEQDLGRRDDEIPSYLFGQNPYLREYADKNRIPLAASLGGAETMYPEYITKVKTVADAEAMARTRPSTDGSPITSRAVDPEPHDGEIHAWAVQGNVHLLMGAGGNIAVQVGENGALVVDTGTGKLADKVVAAIKKLVGDKPIQYIVNTSFRPEHSGGNATVHEAGSDPSLIGSFFSAGAQSFSDAGVGATIIAHNNVLNRMSAPTGQVAPTPSAGWPSDTFLQGRRRKYYNDEAVEIFWAPNAVTDGDTFVHFRKSDVIVTGDLFTTTQYPVFDIKNGGSVQGLIDALNAILDKTV